MNEILGAVMICAFLHPIFGPLVDTITAKRWLK